MANRCGLLWRNYLNEPSPLLHNDRLVRDSDFHLAEMPDRSNPAYGVDSSEMITPESSSAASFDAITEHKQGLHHCLFAFNAIVRNEVAHTIHEFASIVRPVRP